MDIIIGIVLTIVILAYTVSYCGTQMAYIIGEIHSGIPKITSKGGQRWAGLGLLALMATIVGSDLWLGLLSFIVLCMIPLWVISEPINDDPADADNDLKYVKRIGKLTGFPILAVIVVILILVNFMTPILQFFGISKITLTQDLSMAVYPAISLAIYLTPKTFAVGIVRFKGFLSNTIRRFRS